MELTPNTFVINSISDWNTLWGHYSYSMIVFVHQDNVYSLKNPSKYLRKSGFDTILYKELYIDEKEFILMGKKEQIVKIGILRDDNILFK